MLPEFFLLIQIVSLVWMVGLTVVTVLRKPGLDAKKTAERIEEQFMAALAKHREQFDSELRNQALKLNAIEIHLKHVPSREDLVGLKGVVNEIDSRLEGLMDVVNHTRRTTDSIAQWMRENPPRRS